MPVSQWTRPDSVAFPKVWRRFTGKRPMPDGRILKYRIQDVTEELEDAVIDHMLHMFLRDEPLSASIKMYEDPIALQEFVGMYRKVFKQRISLVALLDTQEPGTNSKIVGVHLLGVQFKGEKDFDYSKFQSKTLITVFKGLQYVTSQIDVYEKYGVDKTLAEKGLSVDEEYRGQGIGLELLRAKYDLGNAIGVKIAPMVCSAVESQIVAERAGYELVIEVPYDEYVENGEVVFRTSVPSMKYYIQNIP